MSEGGLSQRLARFVAVARSEDLPDPVRAHATRLLLNGVGTALGGASDAAPLRLARALAPFAGPAEATVIGRAGRTDAAGAAFLNAVAMNVLDFDDNHHGTVIHPTAPIAPPLLAMAELRPISGDQLLAAFALGVECACRIGLAISPGHYARGWHITATCGIFGAALAAGRLLRLDATRLVWALGGAAAQASGLVETLGYMAKSTGVGAAARDGLLSALMAEAGVEGPPDPLGGPRGFLSVTCDAPTPERALEGLGERWEMLNVFVKPYPCGIVLNPLVDACLSARAEPGFDAGRIARIAVRGHPLLKARTDRPRPTSGREAQVSAQHAVAVTLLHGAPGAADFSDAAIAAPATAGLRAKVATVEEDPACPVEAARLTLSFSDGRELSLAETRATGTPGRPIGDDALIAKFDALARYGCPGLNPGPLKAALWDVAAQPRAGAVLDLARPHAA